MRPIKLIMSAFGPYADKVELDMTKLGDRGIYLVTGDTGAGKTTIFDAVCYALYGEPSGDIRSADLFRSKYAAPETPTYVEMEFLYRGELYTVRRNPEYERPALRGSGTAKEDAKASLVYPDGRLVSKIKDVTAAITELLGLDRKQFCQIAMIAQGDFLKLIMAKTDERRDIFREIFHTKAYLVLQEKLKASSGTLHNQYEELYKGIEQYISGIMVGEDDEKYEELVEIKGCKNVTSVAEVIDSISVLVKADKKKEKEIDKDIKESEKSLEELNKKLVKINSAMATSKEFEETIVAIVKLKEQSESIIKAYEAEEVKVKTREELAVEIAGRESRLEEITRYGELVKNKGELAKKLEQAELLKKESGEKIEKISFNIEEINGQLEKVTEEYLRETFESISQKKQNANSKAMVINNLKNLNKQYAETGNQYSTAKERYIKAKDVYDKVSANLAAAERRFLDEQAGIIASKLEEGQPCPVCGSTSHPKVATLSEESVSKEQLDVMKKDKQAKESDYTKFSEEAGRIKGVLDNIMHIIIEEIKAQKLTIGENTEEVKSPKLSSEENIEVSKDQTFNIEENDIKSVVNKLPEILYAQNEELQASVTAIKAEEAAYKIEETKRKDNLELLTKCTKELEEFKKQSQTIDSEIIKYKEALSHTDRQVEEMKDKLGGTNLEEEKQIIAQKKEQKDSLERSYNMAKKNYEEHKQNFATYESKQSVLQKQLNESGIDEAFADEVKEVDNVIGVIEQGKSSDKLANKLSILSERYEKDSIRIKDLLIQMRELKENLVVKIRTNESAVENIKKMHMKVEEVERQWMMVKALSNTANGNITGKKKLLLETYVQMAYFDRIIVKANSRLMRMSAGQYELVRKEDVKDSRSQIGLELDVIDHYNGTKRSVKSLSGGESFKASLSLALGLSDEIQSVAGGIQLDTMFIDEGFGSLDEESLDCAIKTLNDLGQGSRLIGIISHVGELKTRIDKQILVTKDKMGSKAEIVY